MKDQWLRAVAETENVRRRLLREKEDAIKYAPTSFARDMVAAADNIKRALDVVSKENKNELPVSIQSLVDGIDMIAKEIETAFDKHNVRRLHPINEKFDPNHHQAMFEVESSEHPSVTILSVLQDGYILHDRLLRPAMVGVSKTPSVQIAEPEHNSQVNDVA